MPRHPHPVTELTHYLAARGAAGLMHCCDVTQNLRTAAMIGQVFHRLSGRHRRRALTHLEMAFPERSPGQREEIALQSFEHMFQLMMVEALALPRLITSDSWPHRIRLGGLGPVLDHMTRHQPLIMITGHCGNWELIGYALSIMGFNMSALARPLDNRLLNRWLMGVREAHGLRIITKWGATPLLQQILREGGRLGFIADQNAGEDGLFVPFFGHLASSYKSIGLLAMRYRVPIACGVARRLGDRFEYEATVTDFFGPEDWESRDDPLFYITARFNRALEMIIRTEPHQYLWAHRRWKSRPRHEREGREFPARLIRQLEGLPWMTQGELNLIVERSRTAASVLAG